MKKGFYGINTIKHRCIDCGKEYYANEYDPGAVRCPECRIAKYRKEDAELMANLARRNKNK